MSRSPRPPRTSRPKSEPPRARVSAKAAGASANGSTSSSSSSSNAGDAASTRSASGAPTVSVIMATYNRGRLLERLLRQIGQQTFPMAQLEVVLVDDGSKEPVGEWIEALKSDLPYPLTLVTQKNAGAAAARQNAAQRARGEYLIILDDDMQIEPSFVEEHLRLHREASPGHVCVMGRYASDPDLASKPLFERWYANMWDNLTVNVREGRVPVTGTILSTGNASMRRDDFLKVGGFDLTLRQAEDSELGLKLEKSGVRMLYSETAYTLHGSDHTEWAKWLRRNYGYGIHDLRIARKHDWAAHADPWRYVFTLPKLGLPFVATSVLVPAASKRVSSAILRTAIAVDKMGLEKLAMRGAGVVFGMEYFRGVRDENGSIVKTLASFGDFLAKAADAPEPMAGVPRLFARVGKMLKSRASS